MLKGKDFGEAIGVAIQRKLDRGFAATKKEIAEHFGMKPPSLVDWVKKGAVSKDKLPELWRYFSDVAGPEHWGMTSEEWPSGLSIQPPQSNVVEAQMGVRKVPLINYVQAGNMTEIVDSYAVGAAAEWLLTDLDLSTNAFALKIKGDSMLPEFREGDTVIIDPAVTPLPGDYVVAKNGKEEATFKKYRPRGLNERGDEVFELVPLNDDYASIRSDLSPARIIGTMVEHRRYRRK